MDFGSANGEDHAATFVELVEECRWHLRGSGSDDDAIERGIVGKAGGAVGEDDNNIGVAEFVQDAASGLVQFGHSFDREYFAREFSKDGGLIPGAGTDFEDPVIG